MNYLCRYVFKHKEIDKTTDYVCNLESIESGYVKRLIGEMKQLGYELISRDWWSGLCDKKFENKLFLNDKLYDPQFDCCGIVKFLEDMAIWVVDWDNNGREDLFDVVDDSERDVCKFGNVYKNESR
jgi:hypothetical protein